MAFLGLLAAAGVGLTASAAPAQDAERPAFDLSYLPADVQGIYAGRPAAVFAQSGMKPYAELLDTELAKACKEFGLPAGFGLSTADVFGELIP